MYQYQYLRDISKPTISECKFKFCKNKLKIIDSVFDIRYCEKCGTTYCGDKEVIIRY